MGALGPLAAFQAICIALAATIAVDARKDAAPWRYLMWLFATVVAAMGVLAQTIGNQWPSTVWAMQTLGSSPVAWFVFLLALYFITRPLRKEPDNFSEMTSSIEPYNDTIIRSEIAALAKTVRAVIEDYQRMSGLEARINGDVDGLKIALQSEAKSRSTAFQIIERKANEALVLSEKLEQVRVDAAIATTEIAKLREMQKVDRDSARGSLFAIGARETLAKLEASLEQGASDLYDQLKAGESYDEQKWLQWENAHSHWSDNLSKWLETAQWYAIAVKQRTTTIDEDLYGAVWTLDESQFPNAEAVRRFKKHRIIRANWLNVLPDVQHGIEQVAFIGASEIEVRKGQPAG